MERTTRIGFVGVGNMGQIAHLRNYTVRDDCKVVALAEIRPKLAEQVARRYGIERVYTSHREMIDREKLDAIVAPQMFTLHGTQIPDIIRRARLPILIEKPLACYPEMGRRIIDALDETGTWAMVAYHKRSDPAMEYAKAAIDQITKTGELGKMLYVRVTSPCGDWEAGGFRERIVSDEPITAEADPPPPDMSTEIYQQRYFPLINGAIHHINLLRHLMGQPYRASYVDPNRRVFIGVSERDGVSGVIERNPYWTRLNWHEPALVTFEGGYVKVDLPPPLAMNRAGRVEIFRGLDKSKPPETTVPDLPPVSAMANQAANFLRAVRGEAPPPCEAHEAMDDLNIAMDFFRLGA